MSRWTKGQYADFEKFAIKPASVPVTGTSATEQGKGKPKREKAAGVPLNEMLVAEREAQILIGIDPGVNTGFAVKDRRTGLHVVTSKLIHASMHDVLTQRNSGYKVFVVVEDARQVRFATDKHKAQGAGSVKRDCNIWEDFLTDYGIPFVMVRPNKSRTKLTAEQFNKLTGWKYKTNNHGRDAAMLIFNR